MSRVMRVTGRRTKSAQVQLLTGRGPSCNVKFHCSRLTCGVGPADKTGKSAVRYWPGGSRAGSVSVLLPRPLNPRVAIDFLLFRAIDAIYLNNAGHASIDSKQLTSC